MGGGGRKEKREKVTEDTSEKTSLKGWQRVTGTHVGV